MSSRQWFLVSFFVPEVRVIRPDLVPHVAGFARINLTEISSIFFVFKIYLTRQHLDIWLFVDAPGRHNHRLKALPI